jgi:serine/threonine protein kinase
MSANFHGSFRARARQLRQRRFHQRPPSTDLDSTADVHDEFTADLEPSTVDIAKSDAHPSTAASPSPQPESLDEPTRAPTEEPHPATVGRAPTQESHRATTRDPESTAKFAAPTEPPIVARLTDAQFDATGPIAARDAASTAKFAAPTEPPIVARPTDSQLDATGPIAARDAASTAKIAAPTASPIVARSTDPQFDATGPFATRDPESTAKFVAPTEPPIVARPTDAQFNATGPFATRDHASTAKIAAAEPPKPAIDATARMPLPFGRREPFVSAPPAATGSATVDVPARAMALDALEPQARAPAPPALETQARAIAPPALETQARAMAPPTLETQARAMAPPTLETQARAMAPPTLETSERAIAPPASETPARAPVLENKTPWDSTDETDDVSGENVKLATTTIPRKISALKSAEPPRPAALAPGKVLCDRFLLEQVIGCGGTAIVFRARDMLSAKGTAPNMQVAIKTPRPELGHPERAAKRLKHEFEHAKLLSHPSIVRVLELHEDEGHCFMTMELVHGKLLSQLLRDWTMVPASLAYKILNQSAEALSYAHSQNVVHGDFKPGNVFITPEEGVRIVDFGTAAGPSANDSRIPAGTPTYASPEVLSGETPDRRDDVFSFACVAYELLTGQHPFGRQSSLQARDEAKIPPRAWNLSTSQWLSLLSALSWKREQRPASVEELLTRLTPEQPVLAAPMPVHVDPEEVVPAELPADLMPKQRSWGFFAFIAAALLVTYFAFQAHNTPDDGPTPSLVPATTSLPAVPEPAAAKQPEAVEQATSAPAQEATDTTPADDAKTAAPAATASKPKPAAPTSEISFESSSVVTSESSVAAVFLIKRSQPLSGRASVSWKAVSGTADAGIDFASDASGTVTFADGQAQRAIYVPLRNDLLKEGDETFYVELSSPKAARIGKISRAEAVIRDDD